MAPRIGCRVQWDGSHRTGAASRELSSARPLTRTGTIFPSPRGEKIGAVARAGIDPGVTVALAKSGGWMFYTFMTRVVRAILWLLFRPKVEGGENVPSYGPLIVDSNHLSFIDSFIIPLAVPRPVTYIAKADYFEGGGLKK